MIINGNSIAKIDVPKIKKVASLDGCYIFSDIAAAGKVTLIVTHVFADPVLFTGTQYMSYLQYRMWLC